MTDFRSSKPKPAWVAQARIAEREMNYPQGTISPNNVGAVQDVVRVRIQRGNDVSDVGTTAVARVIAYRDAKRRSSR